MTIPDLNSPSQGKNMPTHPKKEPMEIALNDLDFESGCQSEIVDLGKSPVVVLNRLKTMQMTIPPFSKEIIISFDDKGSISNIVFVQD